MFGKSKVPVEDLEYDEYSHGPVYRFFRGYTTYFIKLMSVNALFLVFNIPAMLIAFAFCLVFLPNFNDVFVPANFASYVTELGFVGNANINDIGNDAAYQLYYLIIVFCVMFLIGTTLVCIGPFQSGFATIYKNIARGNGVYIFSDIKEGIKNNWKQSLKNTFVSLIVSAVLLFGIGFYANHFEKFGTAASVFFIVLFCAFIIVQNIVNYMIVSIDLPLSKLYKNAILFLLIKLISYVGLLALEIGLLLLLPCILLLTTTYVGYAIAIIFYFTLAFCFPQYAFAFLTNEMIDLYIVPKTKKVQDQLKAEEEAKSKEALEESEEDNDESEDSDEEDEEDDDDELEDSDDNEESESSKE